MMMSAPAGVVVTTETDYEELLKLLEPDDEGSYPDPTADGFFGDLSWRNINDVELETK